MARLFPILSLVFCAFLLSSREIEGEKGSLPAGAEKRKAIHFTVFSPQRPRGIYFKSANRFLEVRFRGSSRSRSWSYAGDFPLLFYEKTFFRGRENFTPAARLAERPGMDNPLLIFQRRPEPDPSGDRFSISVFDDGLDHLPRGHIIFCNLSGFPLAGQLGERIFPLQEGACSAAFPTGKRFVPGFKLEGQATFQESFTVERASGERLLFFLLPPFLPGSGEIQYRLLREEIKTDTPGGSSS